MPKLWRRKFNFAQKPFCTGNNLGRNVAGILLNWGEWTIVIKRHWSFSGRFRNNVLTKNILDFSFLHFHFFSRFLGFATRTLTYSQLACTGKGMNRTFKKYLTFFRYTPDTRFSSLHKPSSEHWVLELRDTQLSDQGPSLNFSYCHLNFHFSTELLVWEVKMCTGDNECHFHFSTLMLNIV